MAGLPCSWACSVARNLASQNGFWEHFVPLFLWKNSHTQSSRNVLSSRLPKFTDFNELGSAPVWWVLMQGSTCKNVIAWYYLKHSSPRACVKCRFGSLSAGFDLYKKMCIYIYIYIEKKKTYIPRKGSPSCASNNAKWLWTEPPKKLPLERQFLSMASVLLRGHTRGDKLHPAKKNCGILLYRQSLLHGCERGLHWRDKGSALKDFFWICTPKPLKTFSALPHHAIHIRRR